MIKLLSALLLVAATSSQAAEPINILLSAPVGGIYDAHNRAIESELKKSNMPTNYVLLNTCKATGDWLKRNPTKPAVFVFSLEEQINAIRNPDSDGACADIVAKKSNLISMGLSGNSNICTLLPPDQAMNTFLKGQHKIGATFIPPINGPLLNGLIDTLKLNSKAIQYQGNPKLLQALVSRDIDFALFANVAPAISVGAHCFLTTAPEARAKELNRVSLATISPGNYWIDAKQVFVILGVNVNTNDLRPLVHRAMNTDAGIKKNLDAGWFLSGTVKGTTPDQEWNMVDSHVKKYSRK